MNCGIYKIENTKNGKCYIGSSKDLDKRFYDHEYRLSKGEHENPYLQKSWNKYGKNSFEFDVLIYCCKDDLEFYEQRCLDKYKSYQEDNGYNLVKTADRQEMTEAMKEKMRKPMPSIQGENHWLYGKEMPDYIREKISGPRPSIQGENHHLYGKERDKEVRQKISESHKGKSLSKNHKDKISKGTRGENNPNTNLTKKEVKEIKNLLKEGSLERSEIANKFSVTLGTIGKIARGDTWTHITI